MEPSSSNSPINSKIISANSIYDNSMFVNKKSERILIGPKGGRVEAANLIAVRLFDTWEKATSEEPPKMGWLESKKFVPIKVTVEEDGESREVWVKVNKRSLSKRLGISSKDINAMAGKSLKDFDKFRPLDEMANFSIEAQRESFKAASTIPSKLNHFISLAQSVKNPKLDVIKLKTIQTKLIENGSIHKKDVDTMLKEMDKCLKKLGPKHEIYLSLKSDQELLKKASEKLLPYNNNEFTTSGDMQDLNEYFKLD